MHVRDVPYERLERARKIVSEQNPDAVCKAYWTPSSRREIHVEIWRGSAATLVGVDV